ncbi:MAG: ABC transporter ATP-binding protein [Acidimicrobiales bacterium]
MTSLPPGRSAPLGDIAVSVEHVSKMFRLYHDRNQSLKAAVMRRGRARYEEFQALDDVSLEVPAGTTFGLIGENGSGKSTLLKCMARILRPESGTISVNGKISALLELGAGFHPELSGKENIYLNGAILGLGSKDIDRKYDEIVEFAGLEKFIDTPVKNYSSGMYVRLGFSVAINVDPDVLLVDEVLAVGDEEFQRRCNEKFAELRAQNKTIVVVSHGLGLMRTICDELAWLEHGKIRLVGPSGEVVDKYLAEVQTDRQTEGDSEGHGARWGSGEARITDIELLDDQGRPVNRLHTGEAVTIRIRYHAEQAIERPVFGLAIYNLEGILVTGPNTREAGLVPDKIDGDGVIDLTIDRLMLLPGTYDISASLYDYAIVHPFDFRQRAVRFDVDAGEPHETFGGVMSLGGRWSATEGTHVR